MEDTKPVTAESPKKKTNPLVFAGIGCLVVLVLLSLASSVFMKFFAKKAGIGLLQGAIEQKTGVKTNLQDIEKGKLSFTDTKTGTKVDIGTGKLPDSFPKDFPVYPGAKVTGVLSGTQQGKSNGFWVTFTTPDPLDKVTSFYTTNLKSNGWDQTASYTTGDTTTQTVSKGKLSGTVGVTRGGTSKETEIVVMIGEDQSSTQGSSNQPAATETPAETTPAE